MASTKLYDYNTSFSLLRTNPALSGNFKITVDSENKVWFNSFDADPILSGSAYKKFNISGKNSFAQDVYTFFGKGALSPEVIFKVYQTTDGDKNTAKNFFGQYDFFYGSGAQTLVDKNYPEDFSYLAPLWVRSEIPDYFVIFKVPDPLSYKYSENVTNLQSGSVYKVIQKFGTSTPFIVQYGEDASGVPIEYPAGSFITANLDFSTYTIKSGEGSVCLFDELANLSNAENAETYFQEKILPNCSVVKTFDLRGGTVIGDYIRSIFNNPVVGQSPVEVSYAKNAFSYFRGVAVNQGVFTEKGELLNDYLTSESSTPMFDLEKYITTGFSRNGILCANLLNLEFLFDDPDATNYSINRYFGAYVSRNDLSNFQLNGDFLYQFRNSEGNVNYPKPTRNDFGYYYDNTSFIQSATGGVRIYYEGATGFVPGSYDTNSGSSLKLFYVTDKNDNFYSLKRIENWTSSTPSTSQYSYGPYNPTTNTFGVTGSTGATAGTFVLGDEKIDLLSFTGLDQKLASVQGQNNGKKGNPYIDVKFEKPWDVANNLVFRIYWPVGSSIDGSERYDVISSGDFSGTIPWPAGATYHSGNGFYFNAEDGTAADCASALSQAFRDITEEAWEPGTNKSSSVVRVRIPSTNGNINYSLVAFDNYQYFTENYQGVWNSSLGYTTSSIVKYSSKFYQANASVSPGGAAPESSTSWDEYYPLSSSGYLKIKGTDPSTSNSIFYFQGGTDKTTNRVIFGDEYLNLVKVGNWIQTKTGFSIIKEVGRYVDAPLRNTISEKVVSYGDYDLLSVAVIEDEYQVIDLGSDSRFNVFSAAQPSVGVFTFFDFKEFDFDFWSSNYGVNPNYETFRYFQLLPQTSGEIVSGVQYLVKQGQISYNGTSYGAGQMFLGTGATSQFVDTNTLKNVQTVVFPAQFSDVLWNGTGYNYGNSIGYEDNLNSFSGFFGIQSLVLNSIDSSLVDKETLFNYGKIYNEYEYLEENYTVERSNSSRIVPFINKWVYSGGKDSRGNPYRLNSTPAFSPTNFSPSFDNNGPDPKYLTHEWFLLENVPREFPKVFMKEQASYMPGAINLGNATNASPAQSQYLASYFTVAPTDYPSPYQDLKDEVKELFTPLVFNQATGYYETVFRGVKVVLKKRSDLNNVNATALDKYIPNYRGYEGYRYASLLRVIPEDSTTIQSPVSYRFIENNTQKFILFLIDVVANDYRLQALGYTGGTGGNPIVDYTLLYSLVDKKKLVYPQVTGGFYYTLDDIKLSSALDLSNSSGSIVNTSTNPGYIYTIPNSSYDTDLREEVNLIYPQNPPGTVGTQSPTGPGSFFVTDLSSTYPWTVGAGDTFLKFGPVGTTGNYSFNISFSFSTPNTIPVGSKSVYEGRPVFQVTGGGNYFSFIVKRTSFSFVSERVNNSNQYVRYNSYYYDSNLSQTYEVSNSFEVYFQRPTLVEKTTGSFPSPVFSSDSSPKTQTQTSPVAYQIVPAGTNYRSTLVRYSGGYEPLFRKIIYFQNDKSDSLGGVDLSFRNCTFSPETYFFGISRNLNFTKVSPLDNILVASDNLPSGPSYPLIGQTPIAFENFNVFQSSWDPGYYRYYVDPVNYSPVAGTRSMKDYKSFMGSKMMKTPKEVILNNFITLQITKASGSTAVSAINDQSLVDLETVQQITPATSGTGIGDLGAYDSGVDIQKFNQEIFPNAEVLWQYFPDQSNVFGYIRLDRMLRRFLLNAGVGTVFYNNVISEFGVGNPDLLQDDVLTYLDLNVIPIFQGNNISLFVKKTAREEIPTSQLVRGDISPADRARLGFVSDKNFKLVKISDLVYSFEYNLDKNFWYSLNFTFSINKI